MTIAGPVLVRELDKSFSFPGQLVSWNQRVAVIDLADGTAPFAAGTLVEFERDLILFLGQVVEASGGKLQVLVEHSLDQQNLEWIDKVWKPAERR